MREDVGFWIEILENMHKIFPLTHRRTYDMINDKLKTMRPKVAQFCGVYYNIFRTAVSGPAQQALFEYASGYGAPFTLMNY